MGKIIEIMRALYAALISIMILSGFSQIFGHIYSGCASNWWVWEFKPLWIIPTLVMVGLLIVIIKPDSPKA